MAAGDKRCGIPAGTAAANDSGEGCGELLEGEPDESGDGDTSDSLFGVPDVSPASVRTGAK